MTALTVASVLPLALVIAVVIWDLADAAREAKYISLQYAARSVAAAVDALVSRDIALARSLAASPTLHQDNLDAFRAEALRAFGGVSGTHVTVADVDGQLLMNTRIPIGAPLPQRHPTAYAAQSQAQAEGRIVLSDVFAGQDGKSWAATIELPVYQQGRPFRALAVSIDLESVRTLLSEQHIPTGWRTSVVDRQGAFVVRAPDERRLSGQPASATWRRVMGQEGVLEILSADGEPLVAGTALTSHGWSTGIAILRSELNAQVLQAIQWVSVAGALIILTSVVLAWRIALSISEPVLELGRQAPALLGGASAAPSLRLPEAQTVANLLRESAAQIQEADERVGLALDAADGGDWQLDPRTKTIAASERAAELFWLGAEVARAAVPYEVLRAAVHPDDRSRVDEAMTDTVVKGRPFRVEFRSSDFRLPVRWSMANAARYTGLRGTRVIGLVQDITARKESEAALARANQDLERRVAERGSELEVEMGARVAAQAALAQAQRLDALGRLASGVAHDTNNGLAAITAYLEVAEGATQAPQARAALTSALHAIEVTASLNRRFLGFAHVKKAAVAPLRLDAQIAAMVGMLERTLGVNIKLEMRLAETMWPVAIDAGEFDSAVLNLAINSRDAMVGGGKLMIEASNVSLDANAVPSEGEAEPGEFVRVSVSDEGSGMSPNVLARAGDPFFTTKDPTRGTGLGLSSVREVVRNAGGFISIDSREGHGTTVRLFLPRARDRSNAEGAVPRKLDSVPLGNGELVLLVEDHPEVLKSTYMLLEGLGFAVIAAVDGAHALTQLEHGEPVDLVLSDVVLPNGMSGFDIAERVLTRWPHIKVVLASGFHRGNAADRSVERGVQVLSKPYRRRELAKALRAALRGAPGTPAGTQVA